jgi:hypothetical protein
VKITSLIAVLVGATTIAAPRSASAQLGGLMKKAKEVAAGKTTEAVVNKASVKPVDAFGQPLTSTQVDAVLRGLAASQNKMDEVKAAQAEADRMSNAISKAHEGHDEDFQAYSELHNKVGECQSQFIDARHETATRAFQAKLLSDPAAAQAQAKAMSDMSIQMAKLNSAGDTAGARKYMMQKMSSIYGTPASDTAAAVTQCGAAPARPTWLVEEENYRTQWQAQQDKVRISEKAAANVGTDAAGMSKESYALARERMANWLMEKTGSKQVQQFSDDERKAFEAHGAEIRKYSSLLQR